MQVRLAEYGKTLATRPLGRRLRDELEPKIDSSLELDFMGVLAVSHSFADEFIASLAELGLRSNPGFDIRISNASDEVARVIDHAVELRNAGDAVRMPDPV